MSITDIYPYLYCSLIFLINYGIPKLPNKSSIIWRAKNWGNFINFILPSKFSKYFNGIHLQISISSVFILIYISCPTKNTWQQMDIYFLFYLTLKLLGNLPKYKLFPSNLIPTSSKVSLIAPYKSFSPYSTFPPGKQIYPEWISFLLWARLQNRIWH